MIKRTISTFLITVFLIMTGIPAAYAASATISTVSTITVGAANPSVIVTVSGDTFYTSTYVNNKANWTLDTGTTGLTVDSITRNSATKATIKYSGTAKAGTLSIMGHGDIFYSLRDSNTIKVTVSSSAESGTISTSSTVEGGASNPNIVINLTNDTFTSAATTVTNWIISAPAGLAVGTITRDSDIKATISFTGANTAAGTISIQSKAAALTKALLSNTITVTVPAPGQASDILYTLPDEQGTQAAVWLQWPHDHTYKGDRAKYSPTWVEMTKAMAPTEKVNIIVYDATEQTFVTNALTSAGVPLTNVTFYQVQTDSFWIRDNGPVFVKDMATGQKTILDWGFNGWGLDEPYSKCDKVPATIAGKLGLPVVNLNSVVLEGGAIESDGKGTGMATLTSVFTKRNTGMTKEQMEVYLRKYMGIKKMIWMDGVLDSADITDDHVDGHARFGAGGIVTMSKTDLAIWGTPAKDIETLYSAADIDGNVYKKIILPITSSNVTGTTWKGSYCNFFEGTNVVMVPIYGDAKDTEALNILKAAYPNKTVVGINFAKVYVDGGMTHCVTMQEYQ